MYARTFEFQIYNPDSRLVAEFSPIPLPTEPRSSMSCHLLAKPYYAGYINTDNNDRSWLGFSIRVTFVQSQGGFISLPTSASGLTRLSLDFQP
jgi:hypothetical protein